MSAEVIEFEATDGVSLNGYISKCGVNTEKILIEIHGMGSNCFKKREKIISEEVKKINIDTICFNTRGSDIIRYIKYRDERRELAGTAYEDIEESYYDITGAIEYAAKLGYKEIYLQGHSLGASKVVYTFNKLKNENSKLLKKISGIILLSLVDLPDSISEDVTEEMIKYAEEKEQKNEILDLMPKDTFIHPISVKTFLRYVKYNQNIDFARYSDENDDFEVLNKIDVPLFMRWGNINEEIKKDAEVLVNFMRKKIKNPKQDIGHIDGGDHSYSDKEDVLAKEIVEFLKR